MMACEKRGVDGLMMTIYRFQTVKKLAEMLDFRSGRFRASPKIRGNAYFCDQALRPRF
jgi:hypothetical protein